MSRHLFLPIAICVLSIAATSALSSAALPSSLMSKLHPSLRGIVTSRERMFSGAQVFKTYGAAPDEIGVIVYTHDAAALRRSGLRIQSANGTIATMRVRVNELPVLCAVSGVEWIDPGSVNVPLTDVSVPETGALLVHAGYFNASPYKGRGVIILVYDTGIDFLHDDFRDPADRMRTRILSIWDQTITPVGGEASPAGFSYGVEYTKEQIESDLRNPAAGFVRQKDTNGHGTHVAGIAAGGAGAMGRYGGMAPEADLVVVKGGNGSFGEPGMIDGLQYAENVAVKYGKPVIVNWSIGGHSGPHDGTRAYEAAVDHFVSKPGRVVCISAGNDGSSSIHRSGSLDAGMSDTIVVTVPFYSAAPGREDDAFGFDVWTRSGVGVDAEVVSPTGIVYARAADSSGDCANDMDGTITLWNFNAAAMNLHRNIHLYVHDKTECIPRQGTWKLALRNVSEEAVEFDVWLTTRSIGGVAVTLSGADSRKTVSMPATAEGAITVASYVTRWSWPSRNVQFSFYGSDRTGDISSFSSIGPTADGRPKPDIAAPGQGIFAALADSSLRSRDSTRIAIGGRHYLMYGTSMASPHVAGTCALMLNAEPTLSASRIKTLLTSSANTDPFTLPALPYTWGSGKLDAAEAVARVLASDAQVTRRIIAYDTAAFTVEYTLTGTSRIALRFLSPISGVITRALVNIVPLKTHPIAGTGAVTIEVFSSDGGNDARIGSGASIPLALLNPGTFNTVPFAGTSVHVEKGKEYLLAVSLSQPADTLKIGVEWAPATGRSFVLNGGIWTKAANNFRIRAEITAIGGVNGAAEEPSVPHAFALEQNFPNPFNPSTEIRYSIPAAGRVIVTIFDLLGRRVATFANEAATAGAHNAVWNGRTDAGMPASAGVYFYRLESAGGSITRRMLLLK